MNDFRDLLRGAAVSPRGQLDMREVRRRVAVRRRRRVVGLSMSLMVAFGWVAVGVASDMEDSRTIVPSGTNDTSPPDATSLPASSTTAIVPTVPTTSKAPVDSQLSTTFVPSTSAGSSLRAINVRIVDPTGQPFTNRNASIMACPNSTVGDCPVDGPGAMTVAPDDNGDGHATIGLDPLVEYRVSAFAVNTGWCEPWISPTGVPFHFSDQLIALGADLEGKLFVVLDPCR
jgi:hypothetical protein